MKFFNLIKRAVISNPSVDSNLVNDPRAQIQYNGNTSRTHVLWPYGMEGRLPKDTLLISFNVNGDEANKTGIGYTPNDPNEPFQSGEVAFGNPVSRTFIKVLANGDVIIANRDGTSILMTVNGNAIINGDVTINGDTVINGTLKVTGEITAFSGAPNELTFTGIKTTYNSHTHDENDAAPAPTDAPNQLLP